MIFSSLYFLCIFLPLFLLIFYLSRGDLRKWVIVLFSAFFYAWGAPVFIFFLLASSIIDFFLAKQFEPGVNNRKTFLGLSIVLNVGLLAYFKYANFFVDNFSILSDAVGFGTFSIEEVILPIGISFFTFQKISYALDVYYGRNKPLDSFLDYLLYIMMFPQLIAGPIVRFNDVSEQIRNYRENKLNDKVEGVYRFIIGLGKKVLLANTFAEVAETINRIPIDNLPLADSWLGILAYTFQIYYDFAGYSDMAIGLGLMLGIRFPENFNFPYLSRSITEFWQRWHMTLGAWMRDYLYIPLGGNRVSKTRVYFNLLIVFLISGFWHGAAWNFVIWGLFHGFFLMIERAWLGKLLKKLPSIIQILYTFFVVVISWVFFSMEFSDAIAYLGKMFSFGKIPLYTKVSNKVVFTFALGILFAFLAPKQKQLNFFNSAIGRISLKPSLSLLTYPVFILILVLSFMVLMTSDFNPFIYYRF
ncbi:MAG: sugar acetyltransferase [Flavobacteriales bacterium]|nr:sugar acetyltransferase [Flavobacteriales bacterium]